MSNADEARLRHLLSEMNRCLMEAPSATRGLGQVAQFEQEASALIDSLNLKGKSHLMEVFAKQAAFLRADADQDLDGDPRSVVLTFLDPSGIVSSTKFNYHDACGLGRPEFPPMVALGQSVLDREYVQEYAYAVRNWLALLVGNTNNAAPPSLFPADHYRVKYGIQPDTLNKARADKRLSGEKRGGRWFYPLSEVRLLWPDAFTGD